MTMPTTPVKSAARIGFRPRRHWQWLASLVALGCAASGLTIALQYPIAQPLLAGLFAIFIAFFYICPNIWLLLLPAMMPIIGFAPWTGWVSFEELDMLILAAAAAGYARLAFRRAPAKSESNLTGSKTQRPGSGLSLAALSLIALFFASLGVAMLRGFTDAGGFSFGWFQGYHEPMNSWRVGKSFVWALLLVPLWQMVHRQNPERTQSFLSLGLMLGLAGASLATLWERVAFTGLLNFSSDYRTTGLFWEMHVGGAALDGFLALTVPFALREFLIARTAARWSAAATVLALAAYACLTTFSRGVYLAIPVGAIVFLCLHIWQKKQIDLTAAAPTEDANTESHLVAMLLLTAGFGLSAVWIFQTSGYRGMAALLATVALMLPLARVLRRFTLSQWLLGAVMGVVLASLSGTMAWMVPKGAYMAWGLAAVLTAAMLILLRQDTGQFSLAGPVAFAGFLATVAGTALIAHHWGDTAGLLHAIPVLLVILGVGVAAGAWRTPLWPDKLPWQATSAGAMGLVAAAVGVFGGGTYMSERFSTGGQDFGGRVVHWQLGRDMLRTPADWLLGKGLGRFPANFFLAGKPQEHPGDYRLKQEDENTFLTLTSGLHVNGWGELFRVTQRVAEPGKSVLVTARVRAEKDMNLHFEVCEKHLLYNQGCVIKNTRVKGLPGVWQNIRVVLQGDGAGRGVWYAPRLLAFSMAVGSRGGTANLDNVALTGANDQQLLANGDFSEGMAHWFFSSDRHHMPWHIKSIFMNVLFDQGLLGAMLWGLLLVSALWHTSLGAARRHPLAPALAASLTGFVVVGLFDSLLDVPRLGWLYYLLLLVALTLRGKTRWRVDPGKGPLGEPGARPTRAYAKLGWRRA